MNLRTSIKQEQIVLRNFMKKARRLTHIITRSLLGWLSHTTCGFWSRQFRSSCKCKLAVHLLAGNKISLILQMPVYYFHYLILYCFPSSVRWLVLCNFKGVFHIGLPRNVNQSTDLLHFCCHCLVVVALFSLYKLVTFIQSHLHPE